MTAENQLEDDRKKLLRPPVRSRTQPAKKTGKNMHIFQVDDSVDVD
jgi:hypothetical protein